ncbi:unnamed protein product [Durusdinium trenchii]|uniref:Uncharacterized protein n=1 Tax=Durusdinium trenchii TaxID=1381693 RepID=A0ABP0KSC0_9DINO
MEARRSRHTPSDATQSARPLQCSNRVVLQGCGLTPDASNREPKRKERLGLWRLTGRDCAPISPKETVCGESRLGWAARVLVRVACGTNGPCAERRAVAFSSRKSL